MLGEGSGVVGTEMEIAAEENVGGDSCAERKQCISFVYACGSDHTCAPDVYGFSVAGIFYDSGENIAKRAGKRGELLVGRMQNFFLCEKMSKQGEWKWKVDDDDVTVGVI